MRAGNIGTAVADLLLSAGYRVSAWTRTPKEKEGVRCFAGLGQLQQFAAQANVVVCLVPLTPKTRWGRWLARKQLPNIRLWLQLEPHCQLASCCAADAVLHPNPCSASRLNQVAYACVQRDFECQLLQLAPQGSFYY